MRSSSLRLAPWLLLLALAPGSQGRAEPEEGPSPYAVLGVDVEAVLARLSVEEKVGQLLFLGFGGTEMDETIAAFLDDKKPGGVALFGRNIKTLKQTLQLIRDVRSHDPVGIPMFVSVDQEGGNVVRLKRQATVPPSNMAVGATFSEELARRTGAALGKDLALMGFNMNLAPVLDVNSNPKNPVIGIRSFGGSPELVAKMGVAYVEGLQSEGVVAVAKHFPGHGDTSADSHFATPVLTHSKERLMDVELRPFARAMAEGLDALMTAHIALPAVAETPDLPATVSANVLTGILREQLGYDGLVITDGLEMHGIVSRYGSGEAAVRAVLAGADMVMVLWFPEKKEEVHRALLDAVRTGRIPKERLDSAVRRVLTAKARRGLFERRLLSTDEALAALKEGEHRRVVTEVAEGAITLVKNEGDVLPLRPDQKTLVVATEPVFLAELKKRLPGMEGVLLPPSATGARMAREAQRVSELAKGYDLVVFGVLNEDAAPLVARVKKQAPERPVVVVSFGSPYLLSEFPDVEGYVCAFAFREESERAAARVIVGESAPRGRLPVSLPTGQGIGHGLDWAEAEPAGKRAAHP